MHAKFGVVVSLVAIVALTGGATAFSTVPEATQRAPEHALPPAPALGQPAAQSPAQSKPLAALAFMSGCWRGSLGAGGGTIEEHYSTPTSNLIIGMTRFVRGGRTVDFEFSRIEARDSTIVLMPQPRGRPPTEFRLTSQDSISAVWENPAHDFPQRISYRRLGADSLEATIAGPGANGTRTMQWRMARVPCG